MEIVIPIIAAVVGLAAGAGGVFAYNKNKENGGKEKADNLVRKAKREASDIVVYHPPIFVTSLFPVDAEYNFPVVVSHHTVKLTVTTSAIDNNVNNEYIDEIPNYITISCDMLYNFGSNLVNILNNIYLFFILLI